MENKIQSDIQTRLVCSKLIPNQYCLYTRQQYSTWPNSLDHWLFVALTSNLCSVPWVLLSLEFSFLHLFHKVGGQVGIYFGFQKGQ
jgi:hypothetical protein